MTTAPPLEFVSRGPDETRAYGERAAGVLRGGEVIALEGALGAGKTQFVKGLAAGLGVSPDEPVVSPTFVLVREYKGRLKLYHIDAYRLASVDELLAVGLEEMRGDPRGVVAIEWADRVSAVLPRDAIIVRLEHVSENERRIRLESIGADRARDPCAALNAAMNG